MKIDHHKYRVHWSNEHQKYVGLCDEFKSLTFLARTPSRALRGIRRMANDENTLLRLTGYKHFVLASKIISRWPKWKQAIGLSSLRNTDNKYYDRHIDKCSKCGSVSVLHQAGVCNKCDSNAMKDLGHEIRIVFISDVERIKKLWLRIKKWRAVRKGE